MADPLNNEVTINISGQERKMKASFKAMRAIEIALGKPWAALGAMVAGGTYGLNEIATVIFHGLLGNKDTRLTLDEVGEAVAEAGINAMIEPVTSFILIGFRGAKVSTQAGEPTA